jgi:hypothetical protein
MSSRIPLHAALLLTALHAALPVAAKAANLQLAFMNKSEVEIADAGPSGFCFVETGKGKTKRRTAYIVDFDGQCRSAVSAVHHKRKPRNNASKTRRQESIL